MKLLVLGATGPTGRILVNQALREGHQVKAIVRDSNKLVVKSEFLQIQVVDILNERELTKELENQDVVLSTLGTGRNLHSDFISRVMPVLITSMYNAKIKRLIFLSSFGVGETIKDASFFSKTIFKLFLNDIMKDKFKADELLKQSTLDYTLVYPTRLTNGKQKSQFKFGEKISLSFSPKISREDVAAFMLSQVEDIRWIRKTVVISD
jgi:putative NADH-flavin reductase